MTCLFRNSYSSIILASLYYCEAHRRCRSPNAPRAPAFSAWRAISAPVSAFPSSTACSCRTRRRTTPPSGLRVAGQPGLRKSDHRACLESADGGWTRRPRCGDHTASRDHRLHRRLQALDDGDARGDPALDGVSQTDRRGCGAGRGRRLKPAPAPSCVGRNKRTQLSSRAIPPRRRRRLRAARRHRLFAWLRGPRRSADRRPSSTAAPCRARQSPRA